MSSALVRQALELVDPEEHPVKRKRGDGARRPLGQAGRSLKSKNKISKEPAKSKEQITEENIKKLLALCKPTADSSTTEKIVERAIKQKPLADKVEVEVEEQKSILFPDDPEPPKPKKTKQSFRRFEKQLFCR